MTGDATKHHINDEMSDRGESTTATFAMGEENLAWRIQYEMTQRGWSQDRLAQEMAKVGHPIHQSAVSKIIKSRAGKRRTISVDEAIGFARVFGTSLEELLIPLEKARVIQLGRILEEIHESAQLVGMAFDRFEHKRQDAEELLLDEKLIDAFVEDRELSALPGEDARMWLETQTVRAGAMLYLVYLRAHATELRIDWDTYRDAEEKFLVEVGAFAEVIRRGEAIKPEVLREWMCRDYAATRLDTTWIGAEFKRFANDLSGSEATSEIIASGRSAYILRITKVRLAMLLGDRQMSKTRKGPDSEENA